MTDSLIDAIQQTAEHMRAAYRMNAQPTVHIAASKRAELVEYYGLDEVEEAERRWNIEWIEDWTDDDDRVSD